MLEFTADYVALTWQRLTTWRWYWIGELKFLKRLFIGFFVTAEDKDLLWLLKVYEIDMLLATKTEIVVVGMVN